MIPTYINQANRDLQRVQQQLIPVLYRTRKYGMPLGSSVPEENVAVFKAKAWQKRLARLKRKLFDVAGKEFNLNSNDGTGAGQMPDFLYNDLKLRPIIKDRRTGNRKSDRATLCEFHHKTRDDPKLSEIFKTLIEIKLIEKRYGSFVRPLIWMKECEHCDKDTEFKCSVCGGTGDGEFICFEPRITSERDGWIHGHTNYLPFQITLRVGTKSPPFQTLARDDNQYKIHVRDMFVSRPGKVFVRVDVSKAERRFAAVYFDDKNMLDEVNRGAEAVAEFGSRIFGLPKEKTRKGEPWYNHTKMILYLTQYLGGGNILHKKFIENMVWFSENQCQEFANAVRDYLPNYYANVCDGAWEALERGYWVTYHGQRILCDKPYKLMGYTSWKRLQGYQATEAFKNHAKFYASSNIQGPATGFGSQLWFLRTVDEVDKVLNKDWSANRLDNGDSNVAHPCLFKHDEQIWECDEDFASTLIDIITRNVKKFEDPRPYLPRTMRPELVFNFEAESEIDYQWGRSKERCESSDCSRTINDRPVIFEE